ncbi:hypothetical protein [Bradyrhizobium sp. ARR65]|uniref:hypothetical protein n=1 Tax=Bradyrhizobium sp. ARR65 TaxID=1040989 RepID=UPI0007C50EEB|nr:hypothetical protein [Bradyrhizobium sp. ARR65]
MLELLPSASALIADRGYNSKWFGAALKAKGIKASIPPTRNRKSPLAYEGLYRSVARSKTYSPNSRIGRCIAPPRYGRCAHTFFSAVCIAAAVASYLNQSVLSLDVLTAQCSTGLEIVRRVRFCAANNSHQRQNSMIDSEHREISSLKARSAGLPYALLGRPWHSAWSKPDMGCAESIAQAGGEMRPHAGSTNGHASSDNQEFADLSGAPGQDFL